MIKKLIFIIFLFSLSLFLFLLLPDKTFAQEFGCYPAGSYVCRSHLGDPPSSICCRSGGCKCGNWTLNKWEYAYIDVCCKETSWYWQWQRVQCSVADSCNGSIYLQPGICSASGCAKGGNYKICCKDDRSGATCQYY